MARYDIRTLRKWIAYGNRSAENLANMETWRDEAMTETANNKGGDILSGGAGGVNFSREAGLGTEGWSDLLHDALTHIENGTIPTSRTLGRIG
jgi:hypothetical protein